jgi:hypothetical protein
VITFARGGVMRAAPNLAPPSKDGANSAGSLIPGGSATGITRELSVPARRAVASRPAASATSTAYRYPHWLSRARTLALSPVPLCTDGDHAVSRVKVVGTERAQLPASQRGVIRHRQHHASAQRFGYGHTQQAAPLLSDFPQRPPVIQRYPQRGPSSPEITRTTAAPSLVFDSK